MEGFMIYIFWLSIVALLYTYFGYYIFLKFLSFFYNVTIDKNENLQPMVSIIIAAFDEEKVIKRRLENILSVDYPKDRLEVIVGSDGSKDKTVETARHFEKEGVVVIEFKKNRGNTLTHNDCAARAKGEILIFTDAESIFDTDFVKKIVRNFYDEKVGGVTGNLSYITEIGEYAREEGLYFRFEIAIKKLESRLGILASGSGSCFAMRKELYRKLKAFEAVDHTLPLDIIKKGFLVVFDSDARAYDFPTAVSVRGVIKARTRMASRACASIYRRLNLSFIKTNLATCWAILSRRFMRYFTTMFMVTCLVSNIYLFGKGTAYMIIMVFQCIFYLLAMLGLIGYFTKAFKYRMTDMAFIFVVAQIGIYNGLIKALFGRIPFSYKRVRLTNL